MSPMPMTQFPAGSKVKIVSLDAGNKSRSRLTALGLTPGTVVEINASGNGPCRMKVRDCDLVLGQGLASKVLVVGEN